MRALLLAGTAAALALVAGPGSAAQVTRDSNAPTVQQQTDPNVARPDRDAGDRDPNAKFCGTRDSGAVNPGGTRDPKAKRCGPRDTRTGTPTGQPDPNKAPETG